MRLRPVSHLLAEFLGHGNGAANQQANDRRKHVDANALGLGGGLGGDQGGGLDQGKCPMVYAVLQKCLQTGRQLADLW
jgi:hypothetical protein